MADATARRSSTPIFARITSPNAASARATSSCTESRQTASSRWAACCMAPLPMELHLPEGWHPLKLSPEQRAGSHTPRSDGCDDDALRMRGKLSEIVDVDRGDHRATGEIGDRHEKGIHCVFRATPGRPEQPPCAHPGSRVYGMNDNAFPSKLAEYGRIRGPAANELSEHGRNGSNRELAPPHLVNQSADPIAANGGTVCDRGERLAIEK
jgi:hypothetical protein